MKDSTTKLCRQLQKKPAVEGNQTKVKREKGELIKTTREAIDEMQSDLFFVNFTRIIKEAAAESDRFEQLKEQERKRTAEI